MFYLEHFKRVLVRRNLPKAEHKKKAPKKGAFL